MTRDTVVFLPGLLCDRAVWEPQIAALSHRHDCIVADYGADDSLTAMAQSVLESAMIEHKTPGIFAAHPPVSTHHFAASPIRSS